jgi:penicillin-binding protein 2
LDTKLSPLQLANYAATLANNGERMKLTLLKSVKSYTFDETLYEHQPEVAEEIDSSAAFAAIREGMERAAGLGGTAGAVFGNYPIQVACKTGTPETHADPNSTFIAYAPAEDPQIAVCVVIEKGWHGYTGGPVAKEIFDSYFFSNKGKTSASIAYGTLLS